MAATAPSIIEATDINIIIDCHSVKTFEKGTCINLIITASPAIFGATAKKLVIEVGDPSYTSGVHIWKGTADTLKAKPTMINTIPNTAPTFASSKFVEIISKFVEPVKPYIREQP